MPASSASGRGKQASRRRACAPHPGTQARLAYAAAAPAAAEPPPTHTPPAMVRACWVHPRQSCRPPKSRRRRLWPPACRMETGPGCTLARGPGSRQGAGRAAAGRGWGVCGGFGVWGGAGGGGAGAGCAPPSQPPTGARDARPGHTHSGATATGRTAGRQAGRLLTRESSGPCPKVSSAPAGGSSHAEMPAASTVAASSAPLSPGGATTARASADWKWVVLRAWAGGAGGACVGGGVGARG